MKLLFFNSHPHEEDDVDRGVVHSGLSLFNSHPHEEDDDKNGVLTENADFSTHILTRRMTTRTGVSSLAFLLFNSHPHEEDDWNQGAAVGD